jgi:DNA-binding MarR family transcriptional regulator
VSGRSENGADLLFLLLDVARQCTESFAKCGDDIPLTLRACRAVLLISRHEGLSQGELAELADLDPAALVRILDRLETHGWIKRLSDPTDRRAHRLVVTERAGPLLDRIQTAIRRASLDACRGVSDEGRTVMLRTLRRMKGNLSSGSVTESEHRSQAAKGPTTRGEASA